jgi:hypothetical protein
MAPAQVPKTGFSRRTRAAVQQVFVVHQLEHGGAFAAGNHQAVERANCSRLAHEDRFGAGALERRAVRREIALAGKARRPSSLPAPGLHQLRFGHLGDVQAGHGFAQVRGWLRAASRDCCNKWRPFTMALARAPDRTI